MTSVVELNIPVGLCEITYGDMKLPSMADEGTFSAIPKYKTLKGGVLNEIKGYLLESYEVSFEASFDHESYEMLQLYFPSLHNHDFGLYDKPGKINLQGEKLIIHPYTAGDSKEYDICIWEAYIDPQTQFKRTFKKESDKFNVKFIGKRLKHHVDSNIVGSYFFIGDWTKVGVEGA